MLDLQPSCCEGGRPGGTSREEIDDEAAVMSVCLSRLTLTLSDEGETTRRRTQAAAKISDEGEKTGNRRNETSLCE
jgi:hypothetical protein